MLVPSSVAPKSQILVGKRTNESREKYHRDRTECFIIFCRCESSTARVTRKNRACILEERDVSRRAIPTMHRRGSYSTAPAELRIRFTRPQEPFILYIRPLYVCQRFTRVYNLASRVHEFDRNRLAKKEKKRKERGGRGESARERLGEPRRMEWKKS